MVIALSNFGGVDHVILMNTGSPRSFQRSKSTKNLNLRLSGSFRFDIFRSICVE